MLTVQVVDVRRNPVSGAHVFVYTSGAAASPMEAETGHDGNARFDLRDMLTAQIRVFPRAEFWCAFRSVQVSPPTVVPFVVQPIRLSADNTVSHFLSHRLAAPLSSATGRGVKIAIVDSGIDAHVDLPSIQAGATFSSGVKGAGWSSHGSSHGTFLAGLIAGQNPHIKGVAPDAQLLAYCICGPSLQVKPVAVASAVNAAIADGADIINLSIGFQAHSSDVTGMRNAILDAVKAGVLVVAAVGNDGSRVDFPASMAEVLAVGALGCKHTIPRSSTHHLYKARQLNMHDEFVPEFSNFRGADVNFAAPGVAAVATVGNNGYSTGSGTSIAAGVISALAAKVIEAHGLNMQTRDLARLSKIQSELSTAARRLALDPTYVGLGIPRG